MSGSNDRSLVKGKGIQYNVVDSMVTVRTTYVDRDGVGIMLQYRRDDLLLLVSITTMVSTVFHYTSMIEPFTCRVMVQ